MVEKIIAKEKPDAIATMGGQHTAMTLAKTGVLEKHGVELMAPRPTSSTAPRTGCFRDAMDEIGIESLEKRARNGTGGLAPSPP